jgi:hypothetical protein
MNTTFRFTLASLLALVWLTPAFAQNVPLRLSFKFILDSSGNRPATGSLNTVAEIDEQITAGNQVFGRVISEMRLEKTEVVDVSGQSSFYTSGVTNAERDALRNAAIANPAAFSWRTNAINVYITGASASGVSDFPPNNNIIVLAQGVFDTTVAHECGHIMNLLHTHDLTDATNGDFCGDTIADNQNWTRDQIAQNNFGKTYANITAAQQLQVDAVWTNLMSYHNPDTRSFLTPNQMDRLSGQESTDRNTYFTKIPVFVGIASGTPDGTFQHPFSTIQQAINAGATSGRVMVLQQGSYARPASALNFPLSIVSRSGPATIQEPPPAYDLPYSVQDSKNAGVKAAVKRAQECDRKNDIPGVIANLTEAEKLASGREKTALQLEIAQRLRDSKQPDEAEKWFKKVATSADQPKLRDHAQKHADDMTARVKRERAAATPAATPSK